MTLTFIGGVNFKQDPVANFISFHHGQVSSHLDLFSGRTVTILLSLTFKCLSFPTMKHNLVFFLSHISPLLTV